MFSHYSKIFYSPLAHFAKQQQEQKLQQNVDSGEMFPHLAVLWIMVRFVYLNMFASFQKIISDGLTKYVW